MGTRLIGDAYIAILPQVNAAEFRGQASAGVNSALAALRPKVKVGADTTPAQAKIAGLQALIDKLDTTILLTGDTSQLMGKLGEIEGMADNVKHVLQNMDPDGDISGMVAKLAEVEGEAQGLQGKLKNLDPDGNFTNMVAKVASLETDADALRHELKNLDPNGDFSAITAKMAEVAAEATGLKSELKELNLDGDTYRYLITLGRVDATAEKLRETLADLDPHGDIIPMLSDLDILSAKTDEIWEKLDHLNADGDVAPMMAKLYEIEGASAAIKDRLQNLDPDGSITPLAAKLSDLDLRAIQLRDVLENLDFDGHTADLTSKLGSVLVEATDLKEQLRTLDADGNIAYFTNKLRNVELEAEMVREVLQNLDPDGNVVPYVTKLADLRGISTDLRHTLENLDPDGDVFPMVAKLTELEGQAELLKHTLGDLRITPTGLGSLGTGTLNDSEARYMAELAAQTLEAASAMDKLGITEGIVDDGVSRIAGGLSRFGDFNGIRNLASAFQDVRDAAHDVSPEIGIAQAALDALNRTDGMFLADSRGGWYLLNSQIRLFGGALESVVPNWLADVHIWHLGTDAILEFAAAWVPALIAVGTFGAYAYPVGEKIYNQWANINKVLDGVDSGLDGSQVHLKDLGTSFDTIESAIEPSVLEAFGDYMLIIGRNAAPLAAALQKVGAVIDEWGYGLVNWSAKGEASFDRLVSTGARDFQQIGEGFEELFRILGLLIGDLPGYVHALLTFGDAFLAVTGNLISFLGPVLKVALEIHGFIVYVGLAATAVIALSRALAAGAISKYITSMGGAIEDASINAEEGTNRFNRFGVGIGQFVGQLAAGAVKTAQYLDSVGKVGAESGAAAAGTKLWNDANNTLIAGLSKLPGITRNSTDEFAMVEGEMVKVGETSGKGAGAIKLFSGALSIVPLGAVAIGAVAAAAAIGVGLYFAIKHTTDATVDFDNAMQKLITQSNASNIGQNITLALTKTTSAMSLSLHTATNAQQQYNKAAASIPTGISQVQADSIKNILKQQEQLTAAQNSGYAQLQTHNPTSVYNQLSAAQQKVLGEADTYGQRMGQLTGIFGSNAGALQALNAVGIKAGDVATENNATWSKQYTELTALAAGYGYMGQKGSAAANQLAALNISTGTTYKNIQSLTGAESQWISMITSGDSAFTTFQQGFTNLHDALGKDASLAPTVTVTLGKLSEKFAAYGASMSGTSAASLAVRQAFDQQLAAGTTLYGNLQTLSTASGNTNKSLGDLAQGGKAIIAQLLPFAAGSKEATAQVSALARLMGGPATTNFQTLAKWVGNTKGSEQELNKAQADLTITASNLTTAEKNLGNTLETSITQAQAAAISKTVNLTGVTAQLATAVDNSKGKVTSAALAMSGQYVSALEKTGIGANNAAQYLNAYLKQLGLGPAAIAQIDNQLGISQSELAKTAAATAQNTSAQQAMQKATASSASEFHNLTGTLPGTTGQINDMWSALVRQDQQMVKTGNDATAAKGQFIAFAHDGLGITTSAANTLWAKFGDQNLDTIANKASSTKGAFIHMAEDGLHLTTDQAKTLWSEFAMQNLDEMIAKGDKMKGAFIDLARNGLDLTASQANSLWNTMRNQYLDTLAGKANETRGAFVKVAEQLGETASQATNLWNKLHEVAGSYKANVSVNVSGGGKITASVNVTDGSLTTTPATTTQQAGQTNKSGKPLPGLAMGGIVPGYASGGKLAGWHNGGDNKIAGLAGGGAVALQGGEAVVPKNLATHPAFTSFAKYHGIPGYASGGLLDGGATYTQSGNTTSSLNALSEPALAQKIGNQTALVLSSNLMGSLKSAQQEAEAMNLSGPLGPGTAGSIANGESIFKYLMAYAHMTPTAAAGAIASIWGESGWNPFAQGTGGRGLIGWTPPGTISDGAFSGGLSTQLPQVLRFISTSGDWGVISEMNKASSVFQAANEWGKGVERYGINDVHAEGIALATSILNSYQHGASQLVNTKAGIAVNGGTQAGDGGGIVANGYSYAKGGRIRPHSTGGTINEPVHGVGQYSGMPYSFAENGQPEIVSNVGQVAAQPQGAPTATSWGQNTTNQLLQAICRQLQQNNQAMARGVSASGRSGVQHGYYSAQN